ncbi:MAG: Na+/H+ antiporter NhaA [Vicingaceae bacterium]|nr:Na+/H+ antiporter NhaA [Vicingaceae bacterium]
MRVTKADKWIVNPLQKFINNSTTSGIVLFSSALIAIIISNSPWSTQFHDLWEIEFSIGFDGHFITKNLHHWINDGLMAVFFFVVGLELKREIVGGELKNPKNAILPITAAIGGMIFPAIIYLAFNPTGETSDGWGIPMATDIAFALGVLYLLGNKVPLSLKIFLTALAIVDDIGAVLVIAFFYTSDISFISLATGAIFLLILIVSNLIGVRNTVYYAIIGIGGLWLAFLMSGVHATIAAVLAAMTIPADVKVSEKIYIEKMNTLINKFKNEKPNKSSTVTNHQLHIVEDIRMYSKEALTPLQRLEHIMHPFVAFLIMPIFAFSNAGVSLSGDVLSQISSTVFFGVFFGLIVGKLMGVFGVVSILLKLKWVKLPDGMNKLHLLGVGFLASIGFTMSLFIGGLAFIDKIYIAEAKMGVLFASILASIAGYYIIRIANKKEVELG